MIDGKAKPLNAPNYLVNRAKCTRARARAQRMTNERGPSDIDVSVETKPRFHAVPDETIGKSRYKLIQ